MLLRENPIASPLNYTGGKYKLLPQIFPLFPERVNNFVDIFCGGCNVGINAVANHIICNDYNQYLIGLFNYLKNNTFDELKERIDNTIEQYNLSKSVENGYDFYNCNTATGLGNYNRNGFISLRNDFNNMTNENENYYLYLYILIVYSFNNQIRFNTEGNYNLPVGKRDLNKRMINKLQRFLTNIGNITFSCDNFDEIDLSTLTENDFVYADPPYLITCASYNENNGWNEEKEIKLLSLLDRLHLRNIKFALSNVLTSKGKRNEILENWLNLHPEYICHHLEYTYKNSNYHKKDKVNQADEVLITNY